MTKKTTVAIILILCVCILTATYAIGEKRGNASSVEGGPETCTLGSLAKIYESVTFSHEMHTLVAEDCATCHHHSKAGQTPLCEKCHRPSSDPRDSKIPNLKDAYHRQCIGCHKEMEMGPTGCTECHAKKATKIPPIKKKSKKEPKTYTLNDLEKTYDPVTFSHGMHTDFADNCATCHHHSPAGETPACGECHGAPFDPENLAMPGLKGAYHRQCMGCHKEFDAGPAGCTECHAKKVIQKSKTEKE